MLTRRELKEMRHLVTRAQKGVASREEWAALAALALVGQGAAIVQRIADGGYEQFVRTCRPVYAEQHHFQDADFQRMYTRVCTAAARLTRDVVH